VRRSFLLKIVNFCFCRCHVALPSFKAAARPRETRSWMPLQGEPLGTCRAAV
jgi:hypothetical protein